MAIIPGGDSSNNKISINASDYYGPNTLFGFDGNDSLSVNIKDIGSVNDGRANGNLLDGGNGADKLQVGGTSSYTGFVGVSAGMNTLIGGDGKDSAKLFVTAKESSADVNLNDVDLGNGSAKFDLIAKSAKTIGSDASVSTNTLLAGDDNDSVKITVDAASQARLQSNQIELGEGSHNVSLSAKSKASDNTDQVLFSSNSVETAGEGKDTISVKASANGTSVVAGNDFLLADGDNKVSISSSAKAGYSNVYGTDMEGGTGKDSLSIVTKASAGEANISFSSVDLGSGDNSIKFSAQGKLDAAFATNTISGGDGKDTVNVQVKSSTEFSAIRDNEMMLGNGDTSVKFSSAGVTGSEVRSNYISFGDGKDKIEIKSSTKGGYNQIYQNLIVGGSAGDPGGNSVKLDAKEGDLFVRRNEIQTDGDKDKVEINAKTKVEGNIGFNTVELGGENGTVKMSLDAGERAGMGDNTINAGMGDDDILLTAKTKTGFALISDSFIDAGDGTAGSDDISLSVSSGDSSVVDDNTILGGDGGTSIEIKLSSKSGSSSVDGNSLSSGDGGSEITIQANAGDQRLYATGNTITGGDGADEISIDLSTKGEFNARVYNNVIDSGLGNDTIEIEIEGGSGARFDDNAISLGGGGNSLTVEMKPGGGNVIIEDNSISGGTGNDSFEIESQSESRSDFEGNDVSLGDGGNTLSIEVKTDGALFFTNNSFTTGNDSDQIDISVETNQMGNETETLNDNTIFAGDGDDTINLNVAIEYGSIRDSLFDTGNSTTGDILNIRAESSDTSAINFQRNTINGGNGDDQISMDFFSGTTAYLNQIVVDGELGDDQISVSLRGGMRSSFSTISGGDGNDHIALDAENSLYSMVNHTDIDGGADFDTLELKTDGAVLDLGASSLTNFEKIDLTGSNQIVNEFTDTDLIAVSGPSNTLFFTGAGNSMDLATGWIQTQTGISAYGTTFNEYTYNSAVLNVENGFNLV